MNEIVGNLKCGKELVYSRGRRSENMAVRSSKLRRWMSQGTAITCQEQYRTRNMLVVEQNNTAHQTCKCDNATWTLLQMQMLQHYMDVAATHMRRTLLEPENCTPHHNIVTNVLLHQFCVAFFVTMQCCLIY